MRAVVAPRPRSAAPDAAIAHPGRHGVAVEPVRVGGHSGRRSTSFGDPDGPPLERSER
ncbi:hypothetical protein J0H58_36895 [bacterium]|nr:hypothetical protein [bacterium]